MEEDERERRYLFASSFSILGGKKSHSFFPTTL